jgi:hypothetical protein
LSSEPGPIFSDGEPDPVAADDPLENRSSPLPEVLIVDRDHPHYDTVGRLTPLTAKEGNRHTAIILLPNGHHTLAGPLQFRPYDGTQAY